MNLRRAGVLKNKSCTSTVVPCGCAAGAISSSASPASLICQPVWLANAEINDKRDTELILANASPRNPSVMICDKSPGS
ncbi:MAG: hypothetical protein ACD_46C00558G0001 [uncultured bacterium]|nr:MAG: hypothetical protein ACD_46C00558G0001 [uncultured bacterium]